MDIPAYLLPNTDINKARKYRYEMAMVIAYQLTAGEAQDDAEAWTYKMVKVSDDMAVVEIRDEDGIVIGYWED